MSLREQVAGYIPPLYQEDLTCGSLLNAGADELELLENGMADVLNQLFVDTATWGLAAWESFLGLPTDTAKNENDRRAVIRSQLRGSGTVTAELLQSVAQAYDNGQIEVMEEPELYKLTIRFAGTIGLPPNLADLKAAVEAVKPAHLAVVYVYKYFLINQVHNVMTIGELEGRSLYDFAPFIPA